ncbi:stimulated by retinoic acid gene 6 protein-like [Pelodytes ibericus]
MEYNATCKDFIDMKIFVHYSLIPSVIIILILSFLEKHTIRTKIDDKVVILTKRFGFVVPLDLVGTFTNRWTYGFAFGATANKIIFLFREEYLPPGVPHWAKAFGLLAGALEVALCYYPIFACLTTEKKIVGSIIGFFYTLFWLIVTLIDLVSCPHETEFEQYEKVISNWPSLLCLLFLLGRFVHIFITRIRMGKSEDQEFLQEHQAEHVRQLFRKPVEKPKSWFQRKIYTWDPNFRFPNRIISTSVLSLFCLYIFITSEFNGFKRILQKIKYLEVLLPSESSDITDFLNALRGVWFFTTFLASFITVSYVFHILACYRKHIKRLWVGNKLFLPNTFQIPAPSQSIVAIARYSSMQVAYILWGYLIMHTVLLVFGMIFVYLVIYPIRDGTFWDLLKDLLLLFIIPFGIVITLMYIQVLLAAAFFLQKKISPEDKQKPLALDNRKGFQNFNYFFFFYNVIVGFGSCLFRLMRSMILGSWLIARLDRPVMPRGFEKLDPGYSTWIGMIYVDHYHSNPVLVSFCKILLTTKAEKEVSDYYLKYVSTQNSTELKTSVQAKTRWFLFYTLLKNPSLIKHRKQKPLDHND